MLKNTRFITSGAYEESRCDFVVAHLDHVRNYIKTTDDSYRVAQLVSQDGSHHLVIRYSSQGLHNDFIDAYDISDYSYDLAIDYDLSEEEIMEVHAKPYSIKCTRGAKTDYKSLRSMLTFSWLRYKCDDTHILHVDEYTMLITRHHINNYASNVDRDYVIKNMKKGFDVIILGGQIVLLHERIARYSSLETCNIPVEYEQNHIDSLCQYTRDEEVAECYRLYLPSGKMAIPGLVLAIVRSIDVGRYTKPVR